MDELPDVVSARRFKEFDQQQKEELYETLLNLSEAIKDIPKKSLRKTLDVTFAVLQYKGQQVNDLKQKLEQKQQDSKDEQQERLLDENERLKRMLDKLEDEKEELNQKIKDLTDELLIQQKRLQDALNTADISDKDSSDPLSELDKQEELLRNIARKNKHIKRLLKEIETLQGQNIEQSKSIIQLEKELQHEMATNVELRNEVASVNVDCKSLKNTINELSTEIARLEGNITYLEEERENSERDLKDFIERLEVKAQSWKTLLEEKEGEVIKLQKKLKAYGDAAIDLNQFENSETDAADTTEITKMMNTLELRDRQIEQLELKLKNMAEEMLTTTQLMNRLSNEREDDMDPKKPRACCKLIERSLQAANKRCREISEMLERSEEDNAIKSKQALQAIGALEAYQRGEDGLIKAIRKCSTLEQKITSRDKQIRSLVMQLNSMHEIANENSILRKRLNIPDDVIISTKNLAAKERSKDKIIDRLTLKLRASEEMRLQLKLEKTELRKQILEMHKSLNAEKETQQIQETYNKSSYSEIGEVSESLQETIEEQAQTLCPRCHFKAKEVHIEKLTELTEKPILSDLQTKYQEVLEENETLRFGMHEILQKLREYDASSEHITIDTNILCRLIEALQLNSPPHTPKRLDHEKQSLRKRELPNVCEQSEESTETDELTSIGSIREVSFSRHQEFSFEYNKPASTTTNTTIQPMLEMQPKSPKHSSPIVVAQEESRDLHQQIDELTVYRERYEQLKTENDSTRSSAELNEKITVLEIELAKLRSVYKYMREDFDQFLTKSQKSELEHIKELTELNKEIHAKNMEISQLKEEYERIRMQSTQSYSSEEYEVLMKSNAILQAQIAFIVERILGGEIASELKIEEVCADYGVIEDNLQLNIIAATEYEQQKMQMKAIEQNGLELERKTAQLEGLLNIAHDQIQSQQRLLNEITDNHIDFRHLVADLQSQTEEKHLLAKLQRELNSANGKLAIFATENDELNQRCKNLNSNLEAERKRTEQLQMDLRNENSTKELKIKFLLLSLYTLKEKYAKFTPLIFLTNFVFAYTRFTKKINEFSKNDPEEIFNEKLQETLDAKLKEKTPNRIDESGNLIKLVKAETQCKLLKAQLVSLKSQYEALQIEVNEQQIRYATEAEHWRTVEALCSNQPRALLLQHQDVATNTEIPNAAAKRVELTNKSTSPIATPVKHDNTQKSKISTIGTQTHIEMRPTLTSAENLLTSINAKTSTTEAIMQTVPANVESQAVQTIVSKQDACIMVVFEDESTAIERDRDFDVDVKKMQEELSSAHRRIEDLKGQLDLWKAKPSDAPSQECGGIIEKTIMSLNTLLMDKDKSISKYQDLLQNEREHNMALATKHNSEMENLRSTVTNLNFNINAKDFEILELKTKFEALSVRRNSNEKLDLAIATDENNENSLNELTDEKIEEMFQQDTLQPAAKETSVDVASDKELLRQNEAKMQAQLKDLEEKNKYVDTCIKIKEEEVALLKEKLKLCQEREKSLEQTQQPEIERMRSLIEEKDKQINDLMDTLKSFHEDQKNFMEDNSSYSDAQILKLTSDLTRAEATTKIYHTQVEALRRQLTNLTQREKQAREQNQSLRNQLIKRPVVSIKTELNTRVKTENMQKRIHNLELELEEARGQIQRQQVVIEAKRAKSALEVGLWEKQKRWQQNAEKLKSKLDETECSLEKTRTLLQSSRNTIARLEKDKHILEVKLGRATHGGSIVQNTKFCRTPPSLNRGGSTALSGKYSPSESPETYTGGSSDYSSPSQSVCEGVGNNSSSNSNHHHHHHHHNQGNLIEALKARIELQQRKILAMELEGKGTNALTCELEKLQEKLSAIEAQNIRLEARNLQLQLDNDLLRQNDATERLQKRIKHLEDYIIALKEELAQSEANRIVCKCAGMKLGTQPEQTILSLRNLVEKLRAENKYLKDGRRSSESRTPSDAMPTDINRLQQMYSDSLQKINALQAELNSKRKSVSSGRTSATNDTMINASVEFKEQLAKKTQLLQKAKVLLTRAAAKEKVLKEQLALWKRKCSELQNVPVIEEISE